MHSSASHLPQGLSHSTQVIVILSLISKRLIAFQERKEQSSRLEIIEMPQGGGWGRGREGEGEGRRGGEGSHLGTGGVLLGISVTHSLDTSQKGHTRRALISTTLSLSLSFSLSLSVSPSLSPLLPYLPCKSLALLIITWVNNVIKSSIKLRLWVGDGVALAWRLFLVLLLLSLLPLLLLFLLLPLLSFWDSRCPCALSWTICLPSLTAKVNTMPRPPTLTCHLPCPTWDWLVPALPPFLPSLSLSLSSSCLLIQLSVIFVVFGFYATSKLFYGRVPPFTTKAAESRQERKKKRERGEEIGVAECEALRQVVGTTVRGISVREIP